MLFVSVSLRTRLALFFVSSIADNLIIALCKWQAKHMLVKHNQEIRVHIYFKNMEFGTVMLYGE
jgi:hypothetical protein